MTSTRQNRGLDYYINGEQFDQKVSRGVGKAFKDEFGDGYYNIASASYVYSLSSFGVKASARPSV